MEGHYFYIMSVGLESTHKPDQFFSLFSRKQLQFHAGTQTDRRKREAKFHAREHGLATFCLKHWMQMLSNTLCLYFFS